MSATGSSRCNALAQETSPYLLQHAHNPVDWLPWGEEALERARREQKPILLSIGYSACHWCHVMAHESFEDPVTAALMNRLYVNIKVDREERPDLDKIYQTAHHLLTQRTGGWPLTVFLSPDDQRPFFAGTYFPHEPRYGMPAFSDVLQQISDWFHAHRQEAREQGEELARYLQLLAQPAAGSGGALRGQPLDLARRQMARAFDERRGGFGEAPKFPHPSNIDRALRHDAASRAASQPDEHARHIALFTLERMAEGGIHDHLGGGFCRYAVDADWMIPHFEKMLYDNGPLLALYAQAHALTGREDFRRTAEGIAGWVMQEMQSPEGGYYASLDADSEGHEGKYYVWTRATVRAALSAAEYAAFAPRFGLDREPNFEGAWHLHGWRSVAEVAATLNQPPVHTQALLDNARVKLLTLRGQRVRPSLDDKVLVSWNALMIRGMAIGARHINRPEWTASATRAVDFIQSRLWHGGRLLAAWRTGKAQHAAYLDDYAFLLDALLELLQTRWRTTDLAFAQALAEALLTCFEDRDNGGFYFTAHDHESLIQRPRPWADEALPAGNGVAAQALQRLGHWLGETRYLDAAERCLRAGYAALQESPFSHATLLHALEEYLHPGPVLVLRGSGAELARWHALAAAPYAPLRQCLAIPADAGELPGLLGRRPPLSGAMTVYVCHGQRCEPPLQDEAAYQTLLNTL
jgi:hypothetical protein